MSRTSHHRRVSSVGKVLAQALGPPFKVFRRAQEEKEADEDGGRFAGRCQADTLCIGA